MSRHPDFLDALNARQKHWEKGLPWSRFSLSGTGLGVMLMVAALRFPESTPWTFLGGALLMAIGVFSLFTERRVRARRAGGQG
jgi:hypothetical protein